MLKRRDWLTRVAGALGLGALIPDALTARHDVLDLSGIPWPDVDMVEVTHIIPTWESPQPGIWPGVFFCRSMTVESFCYNDRLRVTYRLEPVRETVGLAAACDPGAVYACDLVRVVGGGHHVYGHYIDVEVMGLLPLRDGEYVRFASEPS